MQSTSSAFMKLLVVGVAAAGCDAVPQDQPQDQPIELAARSIVAPDVSWGRGNPGAAYFRGNLYMALVDRDSRIVIVERNPNEGTWRNARLLEWSAAGASLATNGSVLFLSWVGTDRRLNVMTSSDGFSWFSKQTTGHSYIGEPAMVEFQDRLQTFVATNIASHKDFSGADHYQWEGGTLQKVRHFAEVETLGSLSAARFGNTELLLSWRDWDNNGAVIFSTVNRTRRWNGATWTEPVQAEFAGDGTDLDAAMNGTIVVGFAAPGTIFVGERSGKISFWKTLDGQRFNMIARSSHTTVARPVATAANGELLEWVHVGTDGNRSLNSNRFDF